MKKFINYIKFLLDPPKKGDTYIGNPTHFVVGSQLEYCLHGLKSRYGSLIWHPIPSNDCYKMIIESTSMPYHRCKASVLCITDKNPHKVQYSAVWKNRSQVRRINKKVFRNMILDGKLKKVNGRLV